MWKLGNPCSKAKRHWPAFHLPSQCYFPQVFWSSPNTRYCPGHTALKSRFKQALFLAWGCYMNVTMNKTLQNRLVPGGCWKQLMHQCGKGQAWAHAKTHQKESLEFPLQKIHSNRLQSLPEEMKDHGKASVVMLCHSTRNRSPLSITQNSPSNEAPNTACGALPESLTTNHGSIPPCIPLRGWKNMTDIRDLAP